MGSRFATPLLLTTQKLIPDSGMWFDGGGRFVSPFSLSMPKYKRYATKTFVPNLGMQVVNWCFSRWRHVSLPPHYFS